MAGQPADEINRFAGPGNCIHYTRRITPGFQMKKMEPRGYMNWYPNWLGLLYPCFAQTLLRSPIHSPHNHLLTRLFSTFLSSFGPLQRKRHFAPTAPHSTLFLWKSNWIIIFCTTLFWLHLFPRYSLFLRCLLLYAAMMYFFTYPFTPTLFLWKSRLIIIFLHCRSLSLERTWLGRKDKR